MNINFVVIVIIIVIIITICSHVGSSVLGAAQECARIANPPAHHGCQARVVSAFGLDWEEGFPPTPAVAANGELAEEAGHGEDRARGVHRFDR